MDTNPPQTPLSPLLRVFRPIERKTVSGVPVFKTMDGELYCRAEDGSIRATQKKMNGKQARKLRAKARGNH